MAEDNTDSSGGITGFDCKMCGHCCEGAGGIVVSDKDLERLCKFLKIDAPGFEAAWGERRGGKLFVKSDGSVCIFFKKGTGCGVHPAKPDICRAWPYFRGNLVDNESLEQAKAFCPGIPQTQPHSDFLQEGLRYLSLNGLAGSGSSDEAGALQVADIMHPSFTEPE